MKITATKLYLSLIVATQVTLLAAATRSGFVTSLVALCGLLTLPGVALLSLIRPRNFTIGERTLLAVSLSIITLMLTGLSLNQLLPLIGQPRPLTTNNLVYTLDLIITLTAGLAWWRHRRRTYTPRLKLPSVLNLTLGLVLSLLPILSAMGAASLNNNGSNTLTLIMLALIAASAVTLILLRQRLTRGLWPWAIFTMSLALLWCTSLRGWFITGHDIQLEYYVYTLTDATKHWTMASFQDPYNACLSITILPAILKALTGIAGTTLYKVVYQVIFALSATGIFFLARRYVAAPVAFLAAFLCITFPTFTTDMPMLARQEIAFGFFIPMLLVLFNSRLRQRTRYALLLPLFLGLVLSHYSTTFTAVVLLGGTWFVLSLHRLWRRLRRRPQPISSPITLPMVLLLALASVTWVGLITHTNDNVSLAIATVNRSLHHQQTSDDNSGYAIIKHHAAPPEQLLSSYADTQRLTASPLAAADGLYTDANNYPLKLTAQPTLPLTPLGQWLADHHLEPGKASDTSKAVYALAIQGLIILGAALALWRRRRYGLAPAYVILAPVGLALLVVQILVPAIEYGLLRMLQQLLVIVGLLAVLAALTLLSWLRLRSETWRLSLVATALAAGFLGTSGAVFSLTGGVNPPLTLANAGFYYDAYYTAGSDVAAFSWLRDHATAGAPLNADMFTRLRLRAATGITTLDGLTPGQLTPQSYVILSGANVTAHRVALYYQGRLLFYTYPDDFLDAHKDRLYASNRNEVYR